MTLQTVWTPEDFAQTARDVKGIDLARLGHPPTKFFEALDEADQRLRDIETLQYVASFAPPVQWCGTCVCGSVMEIRGEMTDDDYDAMNQWTDEHVGCEGES